ncbi:MAG: AI-2E family transporter [Desulfobacteraceae bacterium]|nr:MAG: AI-2E family transporter [Desulfobacteraceae bacterium]
MTNRFRTGILLILVAFLSYLAYLIMEPFFIPLIWASVFAIVFYPVYLFLLRYIRRSSPASLVTVAIVLTVILGPLSYLSYRLVGELQDLSNAGLTVEGMQAAYKDSFIRDLANRILPIFRLDEKEALAHIVNGLSTLSKRLLKLVPGGLGSIAGAFTTFFIMAFIIFFLFKDGSAYVSKTLEYLPFSQRNKERLVKQTNDVVVSTIYGGVAVALAQGIVGTLGFVSVGLSSPFLWGLTTAITSFIPFIGAHIVWVPICLYLLVTGEILKAAILAAFGILGIGLVDNVVRPLFIKGRARLSFLLTFFAVLGGIQAFGLIGIIVGPLIMALFISLINIIKDFEDERECAAPRQQGPQGLI